MSIFSLSVVIYYCYGYYAGYYDDRDGSYYGYHYERYAYGNYPERTEFDFALTQLKT